MQRETDREPYTDFLEKDTRNFFPLLPFNPSFISLFSLGKYLLNIIDVGLESSAYHLITIRTLVPVLHMDCAALGFQSERTFLPPKGIAPRGIGSL